MFVIFRKSSRLLLYFGVLAVSFIGFSLGFSDKSNAGKVVSKASDVFTAEEAEASHTNSSTRTTREHQGDDGDDGVSAATLLVTPDSTREDNDR